MLYRCDDDVIPQAGLASYITEADSSHADVNPVRLVLIFRRDTHQEHRFVPEGKPVLLRKFKRPLVLLLHRHNWTMSTNTLHTCGLQRHVRASHSSELHPSHARPQTNAFVPFQQSRRRHASHRTHRSGRRQLQGWLKLAALDTATTGGTQLLMPILLLPCCCIADSASCKGWCLL